MAARAPAESHHGTHWTTGPAVLPTPAEPGCYPVNRRRAPGRSEESGPEQLPLPTSSAPNLRERIIPAPEQAANAYIARRAKPSVVPGHVKLTFTLDVPRELTERLSARAIRNGVNLEAVVTQLLNASVAKER